MMATKTVRLMFFLALLVPTCFSQARITTGSQQPLEAARSFVQGFYDWYVGQVVKPHEGPAWTLAVDKKSYMFSPELLQAIKEDSDAQAKVSGEIVGLDFDPFLNTQDPCEHYKAGAVAQVGPSYRVGVSGVCSSNNQKPDVIAELRRENDHWTFTNFIYEDVAKEHPNSANLLAILKLLREERKGAKPKS